MGGKGEIQMKNVCSKILMVLTFGTFAVGCSIDTVGSTEVSSESIYQSYWAEFDEASSSTNLTATFRVGGSTGTTVELQSPSQVTVNGRSMARENFLGTRYILNQVGLVPDARFSFVNQRGDRMENSIRIHPIAARLARTTVLVYEPLEIDIDTAVVPSNVEIKGVISMDRNDSDSKYQSVTSAWDSRRQKLVFSGADLSRSLGDGPATLTISSSTWSRLAQSSREGGYISSTYKVRPIRLNMIGQAVVRPNLTAR